MAEIKQIFSAYTATPAGTVSQVTVLLDNGTVLLYKPLTMTSGKVVYSWVRLPPIPTNIDEIPLM